MSVDECTRSIAFASLRKPEAAPDQTCIGKRAPTAFATEGIDELLEQAS
jgi:hypothetical protein